MATLTVGVGKQFATCAAGALALKTGDTLAIDAGLYLDDFLNNVTVDCTIMGIGGIAHLMADVNSPNDRGIITIDANVAIDHLEISGAKGPSGNDAAIRLSTGSLKLTNSSLHHNQNGILGNDLVDPVTKVPLLGGTAEIDHCDIGFNGAGDGHTHNLYFGHMAKLTVTNSYIHDANIGHNIKHRALVAVITGNRLDDNASGTSYTIDCSNGGDCTIDSNFMEQGTNSQNGVFIAYASEGALLQGSKLTVSNNTFLNEKSGFAVGVFNFDNTGTVTPQMLGNSYFGITAAQLAGQGATAKAVTLTNNTPLAAAPVVDQSSPIQGSGPVPTPTPTPVPTPTPTPTPVPTPSWRFPEKLSSAARSVPFRDWPRASVAASGCRQRPKLQPLHSAPSRRQRRQARPPPCQRRAASRRPRASRS